MILTVDTETTGKWVFGRPITAPEQPRIVQLGAILADLSGKIKGELNLLIKPAGWTIPAEATAIHGITTEDCEKYGIEIRSALGLFNMWIRYAPLLVAHNIDFDVNMVNSEVAKLGKSPILDGVQKYCTMKNSTNIVKIPSPRGYKWPKLQETHKFLFNEDFEGAHDAMADVRACLRCYLELSKLPSGTKQSEDAKSQKIS